MNTIVKHSTGMHVIRLDTALLKPFRDLKKPRVICTVNGQLSFHAAVMITKEGWSYVNISRDKMKVLGLVAGSSVKVKLMPDASDFQFSMPEEFEEVLATDPVADKVFRSLTPGNQRGLIHLVEKVKTPGKRVDKALHVAAQLRLGIVSPREVAKRKTSR